MDKLIWNDSNNVNVKICDEQHKKLFALINRLMSLKEEKGGRNEIYSILKEMVEYSDYHFKTEVDYMLDHNYPEFLEHNQQHQFYMKKLTAFLEGFERGVETLSDDMLHFLKYWWMKHIVQEDKKYGLFLSIRGVI